MYYSGLSKNGVIQQEAIWGIEWDSSIREMLVSASAVAPKNLSLQVMNLPHTNS